MQRRSRKPSTATERPCGATDKAMASPVARKRASSKGVSHSPAMWFVRRPLAGAPVSPASPASPVGRFGASFWHVVDVPAGAGGVSPCRGVGQRPTANQPISESANQQSFWRFNGRQKDFACIPYLGFGILYALDLPGEVAQLVEQRTENSRVVGSIPTLATSRQAAPAPIVYRLGHGLFMPVRGVRLSLGVPFGEVAQLVEQRTENSRVVGSIPTLATTSLPL